MAHVRSKVLTAVFIVALVGAPACATKTPVATSIAKGSRCGPKANVAKDKKDCPKPTQGPNAVAPTPPPAKNGETQYLNDLKFIQGGSDSISCPSGYIKNGQDLNQGAGGDYIYSCGKYSTDRSTGYTDMKIMMVSYFLNTFDKSTTAQSCTRDGYSQDNTDLNAGAGGAYIYFCYKRAYYNQPATIKGIDYSNWSYVPSRKPCSDWPSGWNIVEAYSGSNWPGSVVYADLNAGAGGRYLYMCAWT